MSAHTPLPHACVDLLEAGELAMELLEYLRAAAADRVLTQDLADITAAQARWRLASDAFLEAVAPRERAA